MVEDTQYDKKMKYKNKDGEKKARPIKFSKKNKQRIKIGLNNTDFSSLHGSLKDIDNVDDFYWDED